MIEKIFILHHTHVDLGYTDVREKVCDELVRMVDTVIDLVEKSSNRPEPEQFRWIHEVSWPVIEYMRRGGKRRRDLFEQIRSGKVELGALYLDPTELFDKATYEWSIDYAYRLARDNGLPLTTALFSDSPGIAWSIIDILTQRGVRYLSASPDFIMSYPLEIERPFYWHSPAGNKLLTWCSDWRHCWYAEGLYYLKLHEEPEAAAKRLLEHVSTIEGEGYRWKAMAIHFAMDNAGPEPRLMDFVRHFNAAGHRIEVTLATNRDFFEYMEKHHGSEFETYGGAWPDWWANGNGSAAYEVSCSRRAKASLIRGRAVAELCKKSVNPGEIEKILDDVLMFDEHTWGYMDSVKRPWSALSRLEWQKKRSYALQALVKSEQMESAILKDISSDKIVLANPFGRDWAGVIQIDLPAGNTANGLKDISSSEEFVGQQPAKSGKSCNGEYFSVSVEAGQIRILEPVAVEKKPVAAIDKLHTRYFAVKHDQESGAVTSIHLQADRRILFDGNSQYSFAELIHERIPNRSREALYDFSREPIDPDAKRRDAEFLRTSAHVGRRPVTLQSGPVFNSLVTEGLLPKVKFTREVRIFHELKRIDVLFELNKEIETDYESIYVTFPFSLHKPQIWIENAGAVYRPGIDQLPGSATDWLSVGHYIAISDGMSTITLIPRDAPLVQLGAINTGKWARRINIENAHVFSWIMNNMWWTNFPAYQEGIMKFAWSLTTYDGPFDAARSEEFAHDILIGISAANACCA